MQTAWLHSIHIIHKFSIFCTADFFLASFSAFCYICLGFSPLSTLTPHVLSLTVSFFILISPFPRGITFHSYYFLHPLSTSRSLPVSPLMFHLQLFHYHSQSFASSSHLPSYFNIHVTCPHLEHLCFYCL